MSLPNDWTDGDTVHAADLNAVATAVNANTTGITNAEPVFMDNVTTYGATGNGSTDDTTAIRAAIAAAAGSGGTGTVYFPPGTYITSPLTIPPGVTVRGVTGQSYYNATTTIPNSHTASTLKLKSGSTGALLSPDDTGTNVATTVQIVDLALNCNGINKPAIDLPDQGTSISRFWLIERVYAYNINSANTTSGYGMYIGNQNTAVTMRDVVLFNGTSGSPAGYNGLGWYGSDGRSDNVYIGYFRNNGLTVLGGTSDETFVWRGGGIFTCNIGVAVGGGGTVFEGTSIDHCQADGVYINNGPATFTDCTFHDNSMVGNGSNSNITVGGSNLTVTLLGCRAAPNPVSPNDPKYMVDVQGTGVTLNMYGNADASTFTTGWTNYPLTGTTYNTALSSSTALATTSTTTTLVTSPTLPIGTYLVTGTLSVEYTSTSPAFVDFGVHTGTATATIVGSKGGALSQPSNATQYMCHTGTVSCIVTVTAAGTLVLRYNSNGAALALSTGVNTNLGQSTGITAVKIAVDH